MQMIPLHEFGPLDERTAAMYVRADDVQSIKVYQSPRTSVQPTHGVIVTLAHRGGVKANDAQFINAPSLDTANAIAADIAALVNRSATLITDTSPDPHS